MAKARVLTRSELAEHLGVDKQMVTKWERSGCVCPLGLAHFAHLIWPTLSY